MKDISSVNQKPSKSVKNKTKPSKKKKDQPEPRLRVEHLLNVATFMKERKKAKSERFFLKQLKNTAEKAVYPLPTTIKKLFCKKCMVFYPRECLKEEPIKKDGIIYHVLKCPVCGRTIKLIQGFVNKKEGSNSGLYSQQNNQSNQTVELPLETNPKIINEL